MNIHPPVQREAPPSGLVARAAGSSKTLSIWVGRHELIATLTDPQARRIAQGLLSDSGIVQIVGCVNAFAVPPLR